jgi:heme/copper-type cytochrome/quinol oxidase subunit 2
VIAAAGLASLAFLITFAIAGAIALVAAGLILASVIKYHEYLKVNQEATRAKTVEFLECVSVARNPASIIASPAFFAVRGNLAVGNNSTHGEHHTSQARDRPQPI